MDSSIFLIGPENKLTELKQTDYESEDLLQRLLADHPTLLGVSGVGGKLLLVRRELSVPENQDGVSRWSLDHLFLDRDGVPILVEVKRASDTRARREVVAQMLDYAANGIAYWPMERIVQAYGETSAAAGRDPDAYLTDFLDGGDPESFWRQVEANLRSGRVRLVFVADKIAKELRRIVEFLNEQMRPAEVLAIEVEQFASPKGMRTLVPRLLGNTERAQVAKSVQAPPSEETIVGLLNKKQNGLGSRVQEFLKNLQDTGLATQLTSAGIRLVKHADDEVWLLALIDAKNASVWLDNVIKRAKGTNLQDEALSYYRRLVELLDDPTLRQEKLRPGTVTGTRSLPLLPLMAKKDQWANAISEYADLISKKSE
jgi:hypothetical protein